MSRGLPRIVELMAAGTALAAAAPVIACAAVAVKLTSPGPALFRQDRVGRGGRTFSFVKLRTMRSSSSSSSGPSVTVKGDARVTSVGRVLRKTKLDELPQLWNVVVGDMSLVGPRPEVPRYVDAADPLWQRVLDARPGLTDPVTLRLRNEEELLASVDGDREQFYRSRLLRWKLRGYSEYLDARDWMSDVAVLAKTALAVIKPDLIAPPTLAEIESASSTAFDGDASTTT
jgi:lipopolysaccharide/colanic/teichoic acid biosynthesis glycosyltransferase